MELVFVYNANGGKWNAMLDTLHKVISPKTYPCSLCAITYGLTSIEPEWQNFLTTLPTTPVFLHKDEFQLLYPDNKTPLPAIFNNNNNTLELLISNQSLSKMQLHELIATINKLVFPA